VSWSELTADVALTEGSALWIVGDLENSQWAHKINWYLNFQLRRAQFHQTREIPRELTAVLQTWEIDPPELKLNPSAPLLIESSKLLPNRVTVQLFNRTFDAWVEDAISIWSDLQRPSVRVFLPSEKSVSQLTNRWKIPDGISAGYVQE
jgi:hypothetical protein